MKSTLPDYNEPELAAPKPEKLLTGPEQPAAEASAEQINHNEALPKPGPDQIEIARQQLMAEAARQTAETESRAAETIQPVAAEQREPSRHAVSQELKDAAYNRLINRARKQLNPAERLFSRVAHHKVVEVVSNAAASTIARPSGLIGGGLAACIGSLVMLLTARRYGFTYNYLAFFWLLLVGFGLGLIAELALKFRKR